MTARSIFTNWVFPRANVANGLGRYIGQLQRITIKFCKNNGSSRGIRDFIETDLLNYAKDNPGVVVYLKARRHRSPVIKAEYLNGQTFWMSLRKFTRDEVVKYMELARTQSFDGMSVRYNKYWHTEFPSIQGPWTPFTFKDPKINMMQFPNRSLSEAKQLRPTATETLNKLFQAQQLGLDVEDTEDQIKLLSDRQNKQTLKDENKNQSLN